MRKVVSNCKNYIFSEFHLPQLVSFFFKKKGITLLPEIQSQLYDHNLFYSIKIISMYVYFYFRYIGLLKSDLLIIEYHFKSLQIREVRAFPFHFSPYSR